MKCDHKWGQFSPISEGVIGFSKKLNFCIQYDLLTYLIIKSLLGTQCKVLEGLCKPSARLIHILGKKDRMGFTFGTFSRLSPLSTIFAYHKN